MEDDQNNMSTTDSSSTTTPALVESTGIGLNGIIVIAVAAGLILVCAFGFCISLSIRKRREYLEKKLKERKQKEALDQEIELKSRESNLPVRAHPSSEGFEPVAGPSSQNMTGWNFAASTRDIIGRGNNGGIRNPVYRSDSHTEHQHETRF